MKTIAILIGLGAALYLGAQVKPEVFLLCCGGAGLAALGYYVLRGSKR